ncbi:MAG TPA: Gfo/Idh/MocA family oxidoreductase [Chloroflexota bacterium]|nr:Gfo/Idh/MocA family oxidoreductase [Chloroflexota bacterium]
MSLRVVVVGCGAIARAHVPAILAADDVDLVGLFDQDQARAREMASQHGNPRVYGSWREVLDDPGVECVDLLLPHNAHYQVALEAANAGKHLVVEKPIATSLSEVDDMIAAAQRNGVVLMTCHTVLFEPGAQKVEEVVRSGAIGDIYLAQTIGLEGPSTVSVRPWLANSRGGGVLMAQAIHQVYFLQHIMGPVASVSAVIGKRKIVPMTTDDTCLALLAFTSGAVAEITSTFGQHVGPFSRGTYFYGSEGFVSYQPHNTALRPNHKLEVVSEKTYGDRDPHDVGYEEESQFKRMWQAFGKAMAAGQPPPVTGGDGRAAIEVVLAAYKSAEEGRAIPLPMI